MEGLSKLPKLSNGLVLMFFSFGTHADIEKGSEALIGEYIL